MYVTHVKKKPAIRIWFMRWPEISTASRNQIPDNEAIDEYMNQFGSLHAVQLVTDNSLSRRAVKEMRRQNLVLK